jgi:uncharacterized protein YecE (DUF72 family)
VRGTQVGTSGWSYDHWRGVFYPPGVGSTRWLRYYAERFTSVEVNASFYRLPTERMLSRWVEETPDHFAFVLKGSRLITHARRLDAAEALRTFIARSRTLGPKLHAMLWQLGPTFERDSRRLEHFLTELPGDVAHAFEFRHPSWGHPDIDALLQAASAARVLTAPGSPPHEIAGPVAYVRFHGRDGDPAYGYPMVALREWADFLAEADRRGLLAFAYFNNDGDGKAPRDAARLVDLLQSRAGGVA